MTNRVEDLKMKLAAFKSHGIPARHFRARLFPRPFLAWPKGSVVQTSQWARLVLHFYSRYKV